MMRQLFFGSVRVRLTLGYAVVLLLVLVTSAISLSAVVTVSSNVTRLARNNLAGAVQLADAQDALWRLRYGFPQFLVLGQEERQRIVAEEPQWYRQIEENINAYRAGARTPAELQLIAEWDTNYQNYVGARPRWFELQFAGRLEEAAEWRARTTTPYGAASVKTLEQLIALQRQIATDNEVAAESLRTNTVGTLIATTLGTLVVGLGAVLVLTRSILPPIRQLTATADAITNGEYTVRAPDTAPDELGMLGRAFNQMTAILRQQTVALEVQVADRAAALAEVERRAAEQERLLEAIELQNTTIREMSVPVLPVSDDVLVMPLIGALDSARLAILQKEALRRLEQTSARRLVLDITGVPVVDSQVAQELLRVVQAGRLLGCEVTLVGIRPEVAQTIVGLGLDLSGVVTRGTLQSGIAEAVGTAGSRAATAKRKF